MGLCTCVYNQVRATNTNTAGALFSPYIHRAGGFMYVGIGYPAIRFAVKSTHRTRGEDGASYVPKYQNHECVLRAHTRTLLC